MTLSRDTFNILPTLVRNLSASSRLNPILSIVIRQWRPSLSHMDTCASNGFNTPLDVLSTLLNPTNCTGIWGVISVSAYPNLIMNPSFQLYEVTLHTIPRQNLTLHVVPRANQVIIYLIQATYDCPIYIDHFIPKLHTALPHKIHAKEQ